MNHKRLLLDSMRETLAHPKYKSSTVVPMVHRVRATGLRSTQNLSRRSARGWTRAIRCCLVLLACTAQLWMTAQPRQLPGFAAHFTVSAVRSSGVTLASFDAGQSSVHCALHGTSASTNGGDGPAPCRHGDCPDCPCCAPIDAAIGMLPHEAAPAGYPPPFSAIAAPPARLGPLARFAVFAGQPRAPPILI